MILYLCAIVFNASPAVETAVEFASPYCGLYCVQAAAHALNKPYAFDSLLDPAYLTAPYGSTADDLCRALGDNGLNGKIVGSMTVSQLRMTTSPIILHVRAPGSTGYRHWMLFLGFEGSRVHIYDPPQSLCTINLEELLSIWDGVGIMTSVPPQTAGVVELPLEWLALVALAGISLWLLRSYRRKSLVLLSAAAVVVVVRHVFFPGGFVGARRGLDNVMAAHFQSAAEEIDYDQFEQSRKSSGAIVVDARLPSAYRDEHIPDAVNVPPALGFSGLNDILDTIPKDRHVLVYCQSERCGWSDDVANYFLPRGYRRVSVYRGGINDWRERQRQQDPSSLKHSSSEVMVNDDRQQSS